MEEAGMKITEFENLDCDVTSNCQLSCVSCNRMVVPYRASGSIPSTTPAQVEHDLHHFGKIARTKRWAALGGEPLLHRDLVAILGVVRASGVAGNIAVWSNGMRLQKMAPEFWRAFDTLVVSLYPGKVDDAGKEWITRKCADEGVELVMKDERFALGNWTQILEPAPTGDAYTQAKYEACWFKTYCYALNNGYLYRCCPSPHIPQLLQGRPEGSDGAAIEGMTEEGLRSFMTRPNFMESCRVCTGRNTPTAVGQPWREVRDPEEWRRASAGVSA
jgi:cyclic pyranopterin phosphate synthase